MSLFTLDRETFETIRNHMFRGIELADALGKVRGIDAEGVELRSETGGPISLSFPLSSPGHQSEIMTHVTQGVASAITAEIDEITEKLADLGIDARFF